MLCSIATKITEEAIDVINDLEKDLGKTLLAFQCHDLSPSDLSEEELQKLRETEAALGISLVAVEA